ncbi:hypothetical protein L195_g006602 [Trifolium pratense]|uniref:Uncharacterized protein n=1 Tax=Trifolium pratense TaxID=57577 RepID=A0A2K3P415_TRIPR|nr:hypothetical protein L195_g006602 [Trifolium pratense]
MTANWTAADKRLMIVAMLAFPPLLLAREQAVLQFYPPEKHALALESIVNDSLNNDIPYEFFEEVAIAEQELGGGVRFNGLVVGLYLRKFFLSAGWILWANNGGRLRHTSLDQEMSIRYDVTVAPSLMSISSTSSTKGL